MLKARWIGLALIVALGLTTDVNSAAGMSGIFTEPLHPFPDGEGYAACIGEWNGSGTTSVQGHAVQWGGAGYWHGDVYFDGVDALTNTGWWWGKGTFTIPALGWGGVWYQQGEPGTYSATATFIPDLNNGYCDGFTDGQGSATFDVEYEIQIGGQGSGTASGSASF